MTKKLLSGITFLLFFFSIGLHAQEKDPAEFRYLFNKRDIQFSGFGGVLTQFGTAEGALGVFPGGGGALLINQQFFFGGYGLGLANASLHRDVEVNGVRYDRLRTNFGHGGFWLGYIHQAENLLHFGLSSRIGWGELSLYDDRFDYYQYDYLARDIVFVFSPQIEAELNLTRWFKINAGIGYQWVSGIRPQHFTDSGIPIFEKNDFCTPQTTISLLFGGFSQ
jgi:hypothetical protein